MGLSSNQILLGYKISLQTLNDIKINNNTVEWRIGIMNQRREQVIEAPKLNCQESRDAHSPIQDW
jgi:hypothetical protein